MKEKIQSFKFIACSHMCCVLMNFYWDYCVILQAIICGKIGQAPVQKILRNGKTVTIFTVGTGGMYDQRILGSKDLPKPAQWHRIAVHNEMLGAYAVQQLAKKYMPIISKGQFDKKKCLKMIRKTIKFDEKLEKKISYLLRDVLPFSFFFHGKFFLPIFQRIVFLGKTRKVIEHLTRSINSSSNFS